MEMINVHDNGVIANTVGTRSPIHIIDVHTAVRFYRIVTLI